MNHYSDVKETKLFIHEEAIKRVPDLKKKSGVLYRLNRWREEQINSGHKITYKDLVDTYINLNQHKGSFPQEESGRYINFIANFLKNESGKSKQDAIDAWHQLKKLNTPKTYEDWKKLN